MVFGDSLRPRKFIPRNLLILSNLLTKAISLTTTKLRKLVTEAVFKQSTKSLTLENFLPYRNFSNIAMQREAHSRN